MRSYEVVHEILNSCPNNQMRDVFFREVQTDDPEDFVRRGLKGRCTQLRAERGSDGSLVIWAVCDGLNHRFLFTED